MAIPSRLPAFLDNVVAPPVTTPPVVAPTPATTPMTAAPASPEPTIGTDPASQEAWLAWNKKKRTDRIEAVATQQNWPDWIRKQYGLAPVGTDAAVRGLEDQVANFRAGTSQDLSQQAINWAKNQPYLELWSRGKTSNTADPYPLLSSLIS